VSAAAVSAAARCAAMAWRHGGVGGEDGMCINTSISTAAASTHSIICV